MIPRDAGASGENGRGADMSDKETDYKVEENNAFFWYWFVNISGVGSVSRKKLLDRFIHPAVLYHAGKREYEDILSPKQCVYLQNSRNTYRINQSMQKLETSGVRFVHWESPEYPRKFRQLFDPPYGIYVKGRLPAEDMPVLGMVGSRAATPYGLHMAQSFAESLALQGIQIVSGLAAGIDAASHRGALRAGGYTLGILGGGIDSMYPRENFSLYMQMYERGGVLSEYNLGVPNSPGLFPLRNRLISGIADGVFVLEAGEKSGSFITIDQALEQGKEVFAMPGRVSDPLSAGCNRLIAEGASLVQCPEDIAGQLLAKYAKSEKKNGKEQVKFAKERAACLLEDPEQQRIYELLDAKNPTSFNELLEKSGYDFIKLQYILLEMEISQYIYQPSQNTYLRKF